MNIVKNKNKMRWQKILKDFFKYSDLRRVFLGDDIKDQEGFESRVRSNLCDVVRVIILERGNIQFRRF